MSLRPYYEHAGITIYHGDCREILPQLGTGSMDLVLTDPPYGIGMHAFQDDFTITIQGLLMVPGTLAAVFMSPRRIIELAKGIEMSWRFERLLWMHKAADIAAPWRGWCMNSEAIAIFSRPKAIWPKPHDYRADTYRVGPWERTGHPNSKPLEVVRDLARRLCVECLIDPFMGSGTALVAAQQLGRCAIGIETELNYCEIAANRLRQQVLPLEV